MDRDRIDETIRQEFEAAWCRGSPRKIADVIPDCCSPDWQATLTELVMIDLEFRWKNRLSYSIKNGDVSTQPPLCVEQYLDEFPILNDPATVKRLVLEEKHVRTQFGDEDQELVDDYIDRFPLIDFGDGMALEATLRPIAAGQTLGRYQLIDLHAQGGCGDVWRAFDRVLKRLVALKTVQSRFLGDSKLRNRFENEARTTARLEHPGIVSVHDLAEKESIPYYTMRFLGSNTLADAIRAHHQLEPSATEWPVSRLRLLSSFLSVCRAVEFAHSRDTIHRDLKPQNVALGEFGEISVLDWGLAKRVSDQQHSHPVHETATHETAQHFGLGTETQYGAVLGTPAYMSPEQAAGKLNDIDALSDQYCIGSMLYEILTGRPPCFESTHQASRQLVRPRDLSREIPPALEAICLQAMSSKRDDRYDSMKDLIADFERYLSDESVNAYTEPWTTKAGRWIKRHRTGVAATVAGLLIASLISALALLVLIDVNRDLEAKKAESELLRRRTQTALDQATENLYSHAVGLAHAEWLKSNVVRAEELLKQCPTSLRDWEWYYLKSLIQQQSPLATLNRFDSPVRCLAVSNMGHKLAACSQTGDIVVYDLPSFSESARIQFVGTIKSMTFVQGSSKLGIGGYIKQNGSYAAKLQIWNLESDQMEAEPSIDGRAIKDLAPLDRHRSLLSAGDDGQVIAWNPDTWEPDFELPIIDDQIESISTTSVDGVGLLAVVCNEKKIGIWDLQTKKRIGVLAGRDEPTAICVGDGEKAELWSAGSNGLIQVWPLSEILNVANRRPNRERSADDSLLPIGGSPLVGHTDRVLCLAFNRSQGIVASAGYDRTIRIWDARTKEQLKIIRHHTSHVRDLVFSAEGDYLFSGGDEQEVYVWAFDQLTTGLPAGELVQFSKPNDRLAIATRQSLTVRESDGKELLSIDLSEHGTVNSVATSPDGRWVACGSNRSGATIVNCQTKAIQHRLDSDQHPVHQVLFAADSRSLIGSCNDEKIRIWDAIEGSLKQCFDTEGIVVRLAMDPSGKTLIGGFNDGDLAWWDLGSGKCRRRANAHAKFLSCMATHPDSDVLATSGIDGSIKIWKLSSGELLHDMKLGASWLNCLAFTNDGKRLLSGSEQTVTFWNPQQGKEVMSIALNRCVHSMSFNRDGNELVLAGESPHIRIWSTKSEPHELSER